MPALSNDIDFDLKIAEFRINGYAVIDDVISVDTIDELRGAFLTLLDRVRAREADSPDDIGGPERGELRTGFGRQQNANRYTVTIPWVPPFTEPDMYENSVVLEFLRRYWGRDDFYIRCFHSNTPDPGTEFQRWHRDTGLAKEIPHVGLDTCPILGVKFPLVDTNDENGSVEVLPSTQYIANADLEERYDEVLTQGDFPAARRLNMSRGSVWIQDVRMLHRGTPNRTQAPRPEIVVCYGLAWLSIGQRLSVPPATLESLSDSAKQMLQFCQPTEY